MQTASMEATVRASPRTNRLRSLDSPHSSAKSLSCAEKVISPLLRILLAAGLTKTQLSKVCETAIGKAAKQKERAGLRLMPHVEPAEEVIARWIHHPSYLASGKPMILPLKSKKTSFSSLVKSVSPALPPTKMLRALATSHVVRITPDRKVELLMRYSPARLHGSVDIESFTAMTVDFLRTLEFNFLKNPRVGQGLFQRRAVKVNSDTRLAPEFNQYVREQGQLFLESVYEWLIRHQPSKKSGQRRRKVRLGVGVYVINEALR
jgi:hypothetical protein